MRSLLAEVVIALWAVSGPTYADEVTQAPPPGLKDAQTLEMHRLSVDDMKAYIPGAIVRVGPGGRQYEMVFKSNGTVTRQTKNGRREQGYWRFDAGREVYCESFHERQGPRGGCFAVFASDNTSQFFDYSIHSGHYTHTWWKAR